MDARAFTTLTNFLGKIPAVNSPIATGSDEQGYWWIKFQIDIHHHLAWHTVQELGSCSELPVYQRKTTYRLLSGLPRSLLYGGPSDYLSWVIETKAPDFRPGT